MPNASSSVGIFFICATIAAPAPIDASLFDDEDGERSTLIWSRSRKANAD